jgi:dehydrogenase/reductase SDR family member 7B
MQLQGKVVWLTGASSGIGKALALQLAKKGCKLVLSARRESDLLQVVQEGNFQLENTLLIPFDLNDTSRASEYVDQIISKFGRIDVLVNNGGFSQRAEAKDTSMELSRELLEVNFFSAVALSKAVLPHLLSQRSGSIVVISSIAGKFGFFLRSSYSAAKHALHGYFESFRLETEKYGINTLIVCPGKIKTNISLHAKGPEGKIHNQMDESHQDAMSAEECAEKIIDAIEKKKEEIFVGGRELRAIAVRRFFPALFSRLIRKQKPL